jgi:hypothetical protein
MIRRLSIFAVASTTYVTGGCSTHTPLRLDVRTIADTVRLDSIADLGVALIHVQLRNRSADAIIIGYCEQALEQLRNNEWKTVQLQACAGPAPEWQVPPGDSLVIAYKVEDSRSMRILTRRGPLATGQYRLVYQGSQKSDRSRRTRFESAPFVITVASKAPPSNTR